MSLFDYCKFTAKGANERILTKSVFGAAMTVTQWLYFSASPCVLVAC